MMFPMALLLLILFDITSSQISEGTGDCTNVALGKSTGYNTERSMHQTNNADGLTDGLSMNEGSWPSCIHVSGNDAFAYIDLGGTYTINRVTTEGSGDHAGDHSGMKIVVSDNVLNTYDSYDDAAICTTLTSGLSGKGVWDEFICDEPVTGRYVGFYLPTGTLCFCEAEVFTVGCCVEGAVCGPTPAPTPKPTALPTTPTMEPTATPTTFHRINHKTAMEKDRFMVTNGRAHTCALFKAEGLKCWGDNGYGQLGHGDTTDWREPTSELTDLGDDFETVYVDCRYDHCCAISSAGSSKCWGRNNKGQLGYGHTSSIGDGSNEMGNELGTVDWGTDFVVGDISTGWYHTCAVSTEHVLKCYGLNGHGQLGYGHTQQLGDSSSELGDNLAAVNLGKDFEAVGVICGDYWSCAVSTDGAIKCWGEGGAGITGMGNNNNYGDGSGEMGDDLKEMDLGSGWMTSKMSCGMSHCCSVSTDGDLKCWGENNRGQLGLGNTNDRGDAANEMGNYLPVADLGDNADGSKFVVKDVSGGYEHTCAISTIGEIKCFGRNGYGELGVGHTTQRGDGSNEMGDYLVSVAYGSGFDPEEVRLVDFGNYHRCIVQDSEQSLDLLLKCWGYNSDGQLGYGDTSNRGDGGNEMGDYLAFVDTGFVWTEHTTAAPTSPTEEPTSAIPTVSPTEHPTVSWESFDVVAGHQHMCALYDQKVKCWGYNNNGQLGRGNTGTMTSVPDEAVALGEGFNAVRVYAGYRHSCAVSTEGDSKCWGRNSNGELGLGNTAHRGDGGNEMGDYLPVINWGTNFKVEQMCAAMHHTCALSRSGKMKCVGYNEYGQLGVGHKTQLGDSSSEMGDNLDHVDLGDDFEAVQIECQSYNTCALSSDGGLKCWGNGGNGQLGQGDTQNRGDHSGELGDSLPKINLGAGFDAKKVTMGHYHICAASTDNGIKCWGLNNKGQLGYGDTTQRGDQSYELDDNLPEVDLGTDFLADDVSAGAYSTCATSTDGRMKCWGMNNYGQLGQGSTTQRGDGGNEMGNYLAETVLGSGFSNLRIPGKFGENTAFAFEESSSGLLLKCWGRNDYGQCGYGNTNRRGDGGNEMGDYLAFTDLGFTMSPTAEPTASPTVDPTAGPTSDPTMEPTTKPTIDPTPAPTRCMAADQKQVDWYSLYHSSGDQGDEFLKEYSVDFDDDSYSVTLSATVEYVGKSTDGHLDDSFNLGTTYWIDLQSFSESAGGIDDAGSCGNRRRVDYDGLSFADWWSLTVDPEDLDSAPTADRMAYPPSSWTFSSTDCQTVKYERTFSLAELTDCRDGNGASLVTMTENDASITVSGHFHVELVSPYTAAKSSFYRSYPLVQHEFELKMARSAGVLSETGVQLFVASVMSFGHDDEGNYQMRVLMQSADFIQLDSSVSADSVVSSPDNAAVSAIEEETNGCLSRESFSCAQVFTLTIPSDIDCSAITGEAIDFGGTFQIAFAPKCRQQNAACTQFMESLDESDGGKVVLDVDWEFVDETCGVDLFAAQFGADLSFFSDDQFSIAVSDEDAYVVDQDTIYGQVAVDLSPDDESGASLYDLVDVEIDNVFVCTADVGTDLEATLDSNDGSGGCLSAAVDSNGYYTVIGSGANPEYQGSTRYDEPAANTARFSFLAAHLAFDTERTNIAVHVQLLLTLSDGRKRRMLLSDADHDGANQIRHFIATTNVAEQEEQAFATELVVGTAIGGTAVVAMAVFLVMLWLKNRKTAKSGNGNGNGRGSGAGPAVHVPDLSPSEVQLPTTGGAVVTV